MTKELYDFEMLYADWHRRTKHNDDPTHWDGTAMNMFFKIADMIYDDPIPMMDCLIKHLRYDGRDGLHVIDILSGIWPIKCDEYMSKDYARIVYIEQWPGLREKNYKPKRMKKELVKGIAFEELLQKEAMK